MYNVLYGKASESGYKKNRKEGKNPGIQHKNIYSDAVKEYIYACLSLPNGVCLPRNN